MSRIVNSYTLVIIALALTVTSGVVRATDENVRDRVAYKTYVFGIVSAAAIIAVLTIEGSDEAVSP